MVVLYKIILGDTPDGVELHYGPQGPELEGAVAFTVRHGQTSVAVTKDLAPVFLHSIGAEAEYPLIATAARALEKGEKLSEEKLQELDQICQTLIQTALLAHVLKKTNRPNTAHSVTAELEACSA